jgi:hypothetical protein
MDKALDLVRYSRKKRREKPREFEIIKTVYAVADPGWRIGVR